MRNVTVEIVWHYQVTPSPSRHEDECRQERAVVAVAGMNRSVSNPNHDAVTQYNDDNDDKVSFSSPETLQIFRPRLGKKYQCVRIN